MTIKFRPLKAEEVECRVNQCSDKGCSLLLYKTARIDMELLDEVVGHENWQNRYHSIDGKLFCEIGVRNESGEWIWKSDTGTESNMEAQKGEASDAFKRAGFRWGIGRELYSAPKRIWVGADMCTVKQGKSGRWQCYDDFRVTELGVEDGRIVRLTIANMSRRGIVVYGNGKGKAAVPKSDPVSDAKRFLWARLVEYAEKVGKTPEECLEGVKRRPEWESQHGSAEWLMSVAAEYGELANG